MVPHGPGRAAGGWGGSIDQGSRCSRHGPGGRGPREWAGPANGHEAGRARFAAPAHKRLAAVGEGSGSGRGLGSDLKSSTEQALSNESTVLRLAKLLKTLDDNREDRDKDRKILCSS